MILQKHGEIKTQYKLTSLGLLCAAAEEDNTGKPKESAEKVCSQGLDVGGQRHCCAPAVTEGQGRFQSRKEW